MAFITNVDFTEGFLGLGSYLLTLAGPGSMNRSCRNWVLIFIEALIQRIVNSCNDFEKLFFRFIV